MGYIFLILTILFESAAVICMKLSDGFQNKMFAGIAVFTYAAGFIFLTLALKTLNAGIANAIWGGASTLLIAVVGVVLLHEKLTVLQVASLLLIAIGIVGLNITKSPA